MYASHCLRFKATIHNVQELLLSMAFDARAYPGIASEVRLRSTASTPSLRGRESEVVSPIGRMTPDNGGGNVRVVVRVRAFLPRGKCFDAGRDVRC
jgi:hypothetical protein